MNFKSWDIVSHHISDYLFVTPRSLEKEKFTYFWPLLTNEDNEAGNEEANPDAGDYWNILGSVQHLYLEASGQIKIKVRKKGPPKIKFP